jgi:hypothetical protein
MSGNELLVEPSVGLSRAGNAGGGDLVGGSLARRLSCGLFATTGSNRDASTAVVDDAGFGTSPGVSTMATDGTDDVLNAIDDSLGIASPAC